MSKTKIDGLTYEEAIKSLEEIVQKLEDGDIPLEESLNAFQEGIALSQHCRKKLAEVESKVEYLLKDEQQPLFEEQEEQGSNSSEGDNL